MNMVECPPDLLVHNMEATGAATGTKRQEEDPPGIRLDEWFRWMYKNFLFDLKTESGHFSLEDL
ncbi:hypothetical protein [Syntrophus gentianae]|uniref:hypothetical protein n=1 Tax=Syntrophus gentianae TaxID=43775 RepID=UPI0011146870|nr:hypothetical protein [Syntrophus gentianae]